MCVYIWYWNKYNIYIYISYVVSKKNDVVFSFTFYSCIHLSICCIHSVYSFLPCYDVYHKFLSCRGALHPICFFVDPHVTTATPRCPNVWWSRPFPDFQLLVSQKRSLRKMPCSHLRWRVAGVDNVDTLRFLRYGARVDVIWRYVCWLDFKPI